MNLESTELDVEFEVDPETAWLEEITIGDFRIWHIMFFAFCGFMCIVIVLCCCFRIRIPRTKQDIEADYKRKRITRKFREKMALMKNSDMDDMKGFELFSFSKNTSRVFSGSEKFRRSAAHPRHDANNHQQKYGQS
ncbi:unnamed protein product [Hermetia illucens]|uniref:Transmembrane inner ear expressed protein n=1 Tax=Hermetia illucens TaxID=343691 RepID=A0A7R8UD73_HERIL|nr:unnamed protein product [Hermetia illucens]